MCPFGGSANLHPPSAAASQNTKNILQGTRPASDNPRHPLQIAHLILLQTTPRRRWSYPTTELNTSTVSRPLARCATKAPPPLEQSMASPLHIPARHLKNILLTQPEEVVPGGTDLVFIPRNGTGQMVLVRTWFLYRSAASRPGPFMLSHHSSLHSTSPRNTLPQCRAKIIFKPPRRQERQEIASRWSPQLTTILLSYRIKIPANDGNFVTSP